MDGLASELESLFAGGARSGGRGAALGFGHGAAAAEADAELRSLLARLAAALEEQAAHARAAGLHQARPSRAALESTRTPQVQTLTRPLLCFCFQGADTRGLLAAARHALQGR